MNTDDNGSSKKKLDKTAAENITVSLDNRDASNLEKGDVEDPKPRIVLTFRSEKSNAKSSNMKIVSNEEKQEEFSPRRSSRTRGKWDWVCDSDTSISPKKDKSQPMSENDESDNSHTAPKRTRHRSKDSSDNVLANAIARKEKSYETAAGPTQRLSRRIKPTAKILANEELRIGMESQNNARLGIQADKSPEEGVRTRRSARPASDKHKTAENVAEVDAEVVELGTDDDSQSQNTVMKLKHLCELGLKAINPDEEDENKESDENEADAIEVEDEEIDDDSEVISKLLEADEDTDEDFFCSVEVSPSNQPRRSGRLCSSYGMNDSDRSSPIADDEQKAPPRRSSRRAATNSFVDYNDWNDRPKRKRTRSTAADEVHSEVEQEENSNPAGGEEGSEAACPAEESAVIATCFCETPSNVYAAPEELTEPVFCQGVESVDGVRVGCSHAARRDAALVRAGPRAPYALACALHQAQLRRHMCCPACGLFCSQGIFYQCSEGHLFHLECGLPYNDSKSRPGCPHCGVYSYRWQPVNRDCFKVKVEMKCSNKRVFLPEQREQCTQAYLGFSSIPTHLDGPIVPEDLLPSLPVDLKRLFEQSQPEGQETSSPQELCDAILLGETVEQLIPKIVSCGSVNTPLTSQHGGTCVHAAARRGHLAAVYLLHYAGANLSAPDHNMRTPLMLAVLALLDKPEKTEKKSKVKAKQADKETVDDMEVDSNSGSEKVEDKDGNTEDKARESDGNKPKDEDLMKVIKYLVAAGCDVNYADPEGLTALHMAAQHGGADACAAILAAADALVDPRDHGGWTPLVWAAENSHADVVRVLLSEGAEAATTDNEGNSAVHWCCLAGAAAALVQLLRRAPHHLAAPNNHTDTPLHVAARHGHYACVVILLARGARTDIENSAGELPVDVCTGQCHSAILLNMQMKLAVRDKITRCRLLSSDISNGRESNPIPCVNEVDDEPAPQFNYVTRHVTPAPLHLDCTVQTMQGCSCKEGACTADTCACCVLGVRRWTARGRLLPAFPFHDPPMLFECNQTCACNAKRCENSVVSLARARGATPAPAEVYRVGGARGWGLRARARVRRGAPVALYCGELLALHHADTRPDDQYMFALDVKPDLLEQCSSKSVLCVDAAQFGSAARFINHSCRPNLAPVRVFTHHRDLRLPTVALFATADIQPGEQFTFDYGDKFWSVKSKWMNCECGSVDCRYPVKSTEENES